MGLFKSSSMRYLQKACMYSDPQSFVLKTVDGNCLKISHILIVLFKSFCFYSFTKKSFLHSESLQYAVFYCHVMFVSFLWVQYYPFWTPEFQCWSESLACMVIDNAPTDIGGAQINNQGCHSIMLLTIWPACHCYI